MKTRLAFAAAALLASLGAAQALPVAPVQQGFDASDVTLIAQGCGAGWYRNAYGQCRPMRRGGGAVVVSPGVAVVAPGVAVVAPGVVVAPRVRSCPPGMWRNRYGRCVY